MHIGSTQSARPCLALAGAVMLALAGCGGGGGTSAPLPTANPTPILTSISPSTATPGGQSFTLTADGSGFVSTSVIRWNGLRRGTTFVSATKLTATIFAADIATAGTAEVTVFNPAPGGGSSATQPFSIANPVPTLSSLSPVTAIAESPALTLIVSGTSFISTSIVRWNGNDRNTTFVSETELWASIPASDLASSGTAQVTVFNPAPGGGTSGSLTFTVTATTPLTITTTRLPDTAPGKIFYFRLSATGGVPPYFWGSPSSFPAGFRMHSDGSISWEVETWTVGTTWPFTASVLDSSAVENRADRDLSITVRVPPLGRNDFCTAGSAAGTTQISNGTIRASLSPYGDVDVYSFQGTAGHQVTIETFAQRLDLDGNPATRDSQADTILELLDGNCSRITFNDDIVMGDMQDSLIQNFTLPSSPGGLFFIRVRDFRGDGRPDLIYDLSLSGAD